MACPTVVVLTRACLRALDLLPGFAEVRWPGGIEGSGARGS